MMQMFQGLFSFSRSAVLDKVNMTIWKGTTMENTISKFMNLLSLLFTRVRYQPVMEQHSRISTTLVMVIRRL